MASPYQYDHESAEPYMNTDGIQIDPPKRLTPQFLLNNKLPIFVLTAIPPQSLLTFTIKQGGGLPGTALRIDRSKYPFNVTAEVSPETLRHGGRDVWAAIDKSMLLLVWPADAEVMNAGRKVGEESARTKISKWSTQNVVKSKEIKANEDILRQKKMAEENAIAEAAAEDSDPTNARVMDIVARVTAGELKLDKAIEEFEGLSDIMEERDYSYAIANVKGGKLREWLQGQLAAGVAVVPVKKKKKKAAAVVEASGDDDDDAPVKKKSSKKDHDVFDDSEPDMTDEEREAEELAAASARQRQRVHG